MFEMIHVKVGRKVKERKKGMMKFVYESDKIYCAFDKHENGKKIFDRSFDNDS